MLFLQAADVAAAVKLTVSVLTDEENVQKRIMIIGGMLLLPQIKSPA